MKLNNLKHLAEEPTDKIQEFINKILERIAITSPEFLRREITRYESQGWYLSAARLAKQIDDYILAERLYDKAIDYCNVKKWYCISVVIEKEKSRIISVN